MKALMQPQIRTKDVDSLKFAAGTDRGLIREINEDSYRILPGSSESPCVFIIADGMGGHNCGEVASSMAVAHLGEAITSEGAGICSSKDVGAELRRLVEDTNRVVFDKSLERPEVNGMGTTLTMAVIDGNTITAAHVGDSRLYLIRKGKMQQLTEDHSYIGELVKKGSLTREEAEHHPGKNIITRAIGSSRDLEVDILSLKIDREDIFMLCTDGLTNMLGEDEIYNVIVENDPETACSELIEAAKTKGGEDNITVIVINCE
ncbi:MAG TPA: Stp1/IreP family PP2C-type Ser/Thr phosphatase [Clostridia bacterium]|nr:Stp1/IreP family PP2C-type Ser/Thr phosphatase [Clostridia bacterium]